MSEDTTPYETAFPPKHESTATYSGEFNRIEGYDVAGDKITFERAPVETAVPESPAPPAAIEGGWDTARAVMRAIDGGSKAAIIDALAAHEQAIASRATAEADLSIREDERTLLFFRAMSADATEQDKVAASQARAEAAEARANQLERLATDLVEAGGDSCDNCGAESLNECEARRCAYYPLRRALANPSTGSQEDGNG